MLKDGIINQSDSVLVLFLTSIDDEQSNQALSELFVQHIQPEIEKNLRIRLHTSLKKENFNLNNQEALEIAGETKLLLIAKLGKLKSNYNGEPIQNLKHFVASVTIKTYQQYLRKKYPLRQQLKNKLRYLLSNYPDFALWEFEKGWFCGNEERSRVSKPINLAELKSEIKQNFNQKNPLKNADLI